MTLAPREWMIAIITVTTLVITAFVWLRRERNPSARQTAGVLTIIHGIVQLSSAVLLVSGQTNPGAPITAAFALLLGAPTWFMLSSIRTSGPARVSHDRIADRPELETLLGREIFRSRRYGRPFAVVLAEPKSRLDAKALDAVAKEIGQLVRATDEIGVWSDQRLLMLLAESTSDHAEAFVRRVREALARVQPDLSMNFGIAGHETDDAVHTVLARAEESLRVAAHAGAGLNLLASVGRGPAIAGAAGTNVPHVSGSIDVDETRN